MTESLITVKTFQNEVEAKTAQGLLNRVGIRSFISKNDYLDMDSSLQTALEVKLKVRFGDFKKASKILQALEPSSFKTPNYVPYENLRAFCLMLAWALIICGPILIVVGLQEDRLFISGIAFTFLGVILKIFSERAS